jgi:hypothetical protein
MKGSSIKRTAILANGKEKALCPENNKDLKFNFLLVVYKSHRRIAKRQFVNDKAKC